MASTNVYTEKRELSLPEIRKIMETPTPCQITPRLPQEAGVDEKREFGEREESYD